MSRRESLPISPTANDASYLCGQQDAVTVLNSLQSNHAVLAAIKASGRSMNQQAIPEMIEWCRKIGYQPSDFNRLKPIHIAGTKGKGSTSAFISSILSQCYKSKAFQDAQPQKIGFYTSPHLRFVRERIQINNEPLSEPMFARYFFETWDRLEASARAAGLPTGKDAKPVYFRFLTLMAFHTYMSEGVTTAIIECGIGGEYDSTNILVEPTVTGITSLGIDHTALLGNTIEEIAWHKAGIMKRGAPVYTTLQPVGAMKVLQQRANEKGVELHIVDRHPALRKITLGLAADFQKTNASLAIQIAAAHLRALGYKAISIRDSEMLPEEFSRGLQQVQWGGRCETRQEGNITWCIDGGHTLESIEEAGRWFASRTPPLSPPAHSSPTPKKSQNPLKRILIFNQQTRDATALATALYKTLSNATPSGSSSSSPIFTHAIFCSNVPFKDPGARPDLLNLTTDQEIVRQLSVQKGLAETWERLDCGCDVMVAGTVEEAVGCVRGLAGRGGGGGGAAATDLKREERGVDVKVEEVEEVEVLVTGSLHLVGAFLAVIEEG